MGNGETRIPYRHPSIYRVHGSAPKYTGQNVINPIAAINAMHITASAISIAPNAFGLERTSVIQAQRFVNQALSRQKKAVLDFVDGRNDGFFITIHARRGSESCSAREPQ